MEIPELKKEIEGVEELIRYLKPLYGELRGTPIQDMQQRIDLLTDPLARRFDELTTFFTINELKQVRDKNPDSVVRRKIDALLFFMERKITGEYAKKAIDAEIMSVGKSEKMNKEIISDGLSIVGYANPYLGKFVEEEISILYGYPFSEREIRIKVNLREREMIVSHDAKEIDIIHGCAHVLESAIRGFEPELWDEYKKIKMKSGQQMLYGYSNTEFNRRLLSKGILSDSATSGIFIEDFGLYALLKYGKDSENSLNKDLWDLFNEEIANFEMPSMDDLINIY